MQDRISRFRIVEVISSRVSTNLLMFVHTFALRVHVTGSVAEVQRLKHQVFDVYLDGDVLRHAHSHLSCV